MRCSNVAGLKVAAAYRGCTARLGKSKHGKAFFGKSLLGKIGTYIEFIKLGHKSWKVDNLKVKTRKSIKNRKIPAYAYYYGILALAPLR